MTKAKFLFFFLFFALVFNGCGKSKNEGEIFVSVRNTDDTEVDGIYDLYIEKDYIPAALEPFEGCYTGAYILSDKNVEFSIEKFEDTVSKKHAVYSSYMRLGDEFPLKWILECCYKMKTPMIILQPPNEYDPFNEQLLEETASSIGKFNIPVFIQFYPNPSNITSDGKKYVDFFKKAREVFAGKAKNTVFVWCIKSEDIIDGSFFYPGDDYVDWVGINIYEEFNSEKNDFNRNIRTNFEYFYYTYGKTKPVMISQMAVSHYSENDHLYRTNEAAEEIYGFYQDIVSQYPRVKAINYMNFNSSDFLPGKLFGSDFSVTGEKKLIEAYKKAVSDRRYLESVMEENSDARKELFKSPFKAYSSKDRFFINEKSFVYDTNMKGVDDEDKVSVLGEVCVRCFDGKELYGYAVDIDSESKIIYLRKR